MLMNKKEILLIHKDLSIRDLTMYLTIILDGKTIQWPIWCSIHRPERMITTDITHYWVKGTFNSTQQCQLFTPSVLCIWLTSSDSEESSSYQQLQSAQPIITISRSLTTLPTRWLLTKIWLIWLENSGMKNIFNPLDISKTEVSTMFELMH